MLASWVASLAVSVRLGSPAGTTRGFGPAEFRHIGDLIADVLDAHAAGSNGDSAKAEAAAPMGQLAKTHQLAGLITYMLSPDSGIMTGAMVDYDQNVPGIIGE